LRSSRKTRTAASFPGPRRSSSRLLAGLALALLAAAAPAQDTRIARTPAQVVDGLLGASVAVRRQALKAAAEEAAEVVPLLVKALESRPPASLPYDAVRALGDLKDARVSAALAALCRTPGFPWKPQALEALADHAYPGAVPLFAQGVISPAVRSRAASCRGITAVGVKEMDSVLSDCLGDEEASVRLEAARGLIKLTGDYSGVPVVVRDLSLDRRFADANHGSVARDAAAAFLKELGGMDRDSQPEPAGAAQLAAVLAALRAKLGLAAEGFPAEVAPHEPDVPDSFRYAVEVRSCPEGDFYLRCDGEGNVVFGRDLLRRFTVEPKLLDPLRKALDGMDTGGKRRKIVGTVACDFERLGAKDQEGWRTLVVGMGRHDPSLDPVHAAVVEVVRRARGGDLAAEHERRVTPFLPGAAPASRAESRPSGAGR
jgi:hypothetical protein